MYPTILHYLDKFGISNEGKTLYAAGYQLSKTGLRAIFNIKPQEVNLAFNHVIQNRRASSELNHFVLCRMLSKISYGKYQKQLNNDNMQKLEKNMCDNNLKFGIYNVKGKPLTMHSSANDIQYMALFDTLEEAKEWYESEVEKSSFKTIDHMKSSAKSTSKILTKFSNGIIEFLENNFKKDGNNYIGNEVIISYNQHQNQIYIKNPDGKVFIIFDIDVIDVQNLIQHLALYL